jgi:hypothetical protein
MGMNAEKRSLAWIEGKLAAAKPVFPLLALLSSASSQFATQTGARFSNIFINPFMINYGSDFQEYPRPNKDVAAFPRKVSNLAARRITHG